LVLGAVVRQIDAVSLSVTLALVIESFRSKVLKRFWLRGDPSGIRPDWLPKVRNRMIFLERAATPQDLDIPGFGFHPLSGDQAGRYALTVSRNWRLTFGWSGKNAVDVDLEDYHGD
jgi:toxin HigB-1